MAEPVTDELSSSDEEAPEQLTFQRGREEAAQSLKRVNQALQREKALLKEKRRWREELFKEQKKRKLLSDEVLEEVAAQPQKRSNEQSNSQEQGKDADASESGGEKSEDEASEDETSDARLKVNYSAMRLKDQDQRSIQQQTAKDFVQKHLYGPGSKRTTVNQFFSTASKRGTIKKPAVQFINGAWGAEKKRKAKKFKARWVKRLAPT